MKTINWRKVIAAMNERAAKLSVMADQETEEGRSGIAVLYSKRAIELTEMASFLEAGLEE